MRPKEVEDLAKAGTLASDRRFQGVVGELETLRTLVDRGGLQTEGVSKLRFATLQLKVPGLGKRNFDFSVFVAGVSKTCSTGCRGVIPSGASLRNTIAKHTGGLPRTVDLGRNSVFLHFEVTTAGITKENRLNPTTLAAQQRFVYGEMLERAGKVALAQGLFNKMNRANNYFNNQAVLAVDREAFGLLTPDQQATIKNTVTAPGGMMTLVDNLRTQTFRTMHAAQNELRK
jgi:hypothetical protein